MTFIKNECLLSFFLISFFFSESLSAMKESDLDFQEEKIYKIKNKCSNNILSSLGMQTGGGDQNRGTATMQKDSDDKDVNQRLWKIIRGKNKYSNYFKIKNIHSGNILNHWWGTEPNKKGKHLATMQINDCDKRYEDHRFWFLEKCGKYYKIKNFSSGHYLSCDGEKIGVSTVIMKQGSPTKIKKRKHEALNKTGVSILKELNEERKKRVDTKEYIESRASDIKILKEALNELGKIVKSDNHKSANYLLWSFTAVNEKKEEEKKEKSNQVLIEKESNFALALEKRDTAKIEKIISSFEENKGDRNQLICRLTSLISQNELKLEQELEKEFTLKQRDEENIIVKNERSIDWFYTGLSIDGGGIKGVMPAIWLQEIEEMAPKTRIWELFDYIGGTSIGGILALGCVASKKDTSIPLIETQTLVDLFKKKGDLIFNERKASLGYIKTNFTIEEILGFMLPALFPIPSLIISPAVKTVIKKTGIPGTTKYNASKLEEELFYQFGDTSLKNALTNVLVTAATTDHRPVILSSRNAKYDKKKNCFLWKAARSTSAAPTYFPAYELLNKKDEKNIAWGDRLIDGGLWYNNPSELVYNEIRRIYDVSAKDVLFVSLGTGNYPITPFPFHSCSLQAAEPSIFGMMQNSSEGVHQSLVREFRWTDQYYRLNPSFSKDIPLDATDPTSISKLEEEAKYVGGDGLIEEIARRLLDNKDRRNDEKK